MRDSLISGQATGNLVHDAHIAALLVEHGVRELWIADRDFARPSCAAPRPHTATGDAPV